MRLQDQVILITGSTTGIGEYMARRFVAEGARVILHGRDAARGAALRKELGEDRSAFCQGGSQITATTVSIEEDKIVLSVKTTSKTPLGNRDCVLSNPDGKTAKLSRSNYVSQ